MRGTGRRGLAVLLLAWPLWLAAQVPGTAGQGPETGVAPEAPAVVAAVETAPPLEPIPFAAADAAAVRVPSAPGAWGGPRADDAPTLSDRVVGYRIEAELDAEKHQVLGTERLTWRNRSARPVDRIYLHLYLNAFRNEASTWFSERRRLGLGNGPRGALLNAGEWGWIDLTRVAQGDAGLAWHYVQPDHGPATDRTVVEVELAEPVPAGGTLALDIDFLSQLPRVVERTGWLGQFHLVGQWFPKIGVLELPGERGATAPRWNVHEFHLNSEFYADYGSYDVRITAPADYLIGAVGELVGTPESAAGKRSWRFHQDDVHDFAFVAAKDLVEMTARWRGEGGSEVAIRVLHPAEYAAAARRALVSTEAALEYFSRTLGPYPYRTVTVVLPPWNAEAAGGMEYPTFFTASSVLDPVPGSLDELEADFTTIHEFGHGYFYGILGSNEFEEPMLDEGLNEFWDVRMLAGSRREVEFVPPWLRRFGIGPRMDGFTLSRLAASLRDSPDPLGANAWDRLSGRSYGSVYSRTAVVLYDLEAELGSEAFGRAMQAYYRQWKFRHPSIADLRAALATATGKPEVVDRLFDGYVFGTAEIDDRVAYIRTRELLPTPGLAEADGKPAEPDPAVRAEQIEATRAAWRRQHPDAAPGTGPYPWYSTVILRRDGLALPQTVRVRFVDGSQEDVAWTATGRWTRLEFTRPSAVLSAEIDPDRRRLLDIDKLNDSRSREPDGAASRRWSADAAALLQGVFGVLGGL